MKATFRHVIIVLFSIVLFSNCAKRGTPSGGPKDSIPPIIVRSSPENFTTQFSGDEIRIYFDEYIKLKDIQQNLIISPPLKYTPVITPLSTSKILKIKILDTLKENTTYSFNFGKSIVDNNEENEFEYYKYIFSTGDYIDSLTVTGQIKDAYLAKPDKPTTILLYERTESFMDSIIFSEKPTYITTTRDSTQQFELSNLKEGNYLLIALQEEVNNYIFEPKKDKIGFIDGVVSTPNDSSYVLSLFKEIPTYKIARPSHVSKNKIIFGYEGDATQMKLEPLTELPSDFSYTTYWDSKSDTLNYFFKPAFDLEQTDTLLYLAKNRLVEDTLIVKLKDLFADSLQIDKLGSTIVVPNDTLQIQVNNPIVAIDPEKIAIMDKDSVTVAFTTSLDKKYNLVNIVYPKTEAQQYQIELLPNAITDFFENTNDTLNFGARTLELSDYGELGMKLLNVKQYPILVELVGSKYKVVASKYLTKAEDLYFNYVSPDQYYFRIIYDENENGIWDTGNFLTRQQAEEVVYFPKKIDIRSNFFINETFNLE